MTLARGTLYAEQAIHCEESHNSTFTRVHLIACYACAFCNIVPVRSRADICRQLEGEVELGRTGQQPAAVGGNLEDRGDTRDPTKPIQNQTNLHRREDTRPVSITY